MMSSAMALITTSTCGAVAGGSRTAQSALYAQDLCDDRLDEMVPSDKEGGRTVDAQTKEETTREPDIMIFLKKYLSSR